MIAEVSFLLLHVRALRPNALNSFAFGQLLFQPAPPPRATRQYAGSAAFASQPQWQSPINRGPGSLRFWQCGFDRILQMKGPVLQYTNHGVLLQ